MFFTAALYGKLLQTRLFLKTNQVASFLLIWLWIFITASRCEQTDTRHCGVSNKVTQESKRNIPDFSALSQFLAGCRDQLASLLSAVLRLMFGTFPGFSMRLPSYRDVV